MKKEFEFYGEINKKISLSDEYFSLLPEGRYSVFPGFCDVHVHFREPGFSYKETIMTGSLAAAHGGYTSVCTMPNLKPCPDSAKNLNEQLNIIKKDSVIDIFPYASITDNQGGCDIVDMKELSEAVAFSDDGRGIQSEKIMYNAMLRAKSVGKIIVAHCENNLLLNDGYIHNGDYCKKNNHRGISSESEWSQIERDIFLAKKTGCPYHVCHVSAKESVDLIRKAKKGGIDITCETAPHYLVLDDSMLEEDGRFKMNPPIRSADDKNALINGVLDGTIDMIATDHAPHSTEEKSKGLKESLFGIVGLETSFQLMYTCLVNEKIISMNRLIMLMDENPRKRFKIPLCGYSVWNLDDKYTVNPSDFLSKGKSTPFNGWKVNGVNYQTVNKNKIVYLKQEFGDDKNG